MINWKQRLVYLREISSIFPMTTNNRVGQMCKGASANLEVIFKTQKLPLISTLSQGKGSVKHFLSDRFTFTFTNLQIFSLIFKSLCLKENLTFSQRFTLHLHLEILFFSLFNFCVCKRI